MKTLNLKQGSPEWHDHRDQHLNASDAAAMLGISPYKTRDELLAEVKFGTTQEFTPEQRQRMQRGHEFEAAARPIAEEYIGEKLYPVTGTEEIDGLPLSASFDGINMLETVTWEHKSINAEYRACESIDDVPEKDKIQMEQGLMVSGTEKCLFMASDGTTDDMVRFWYWSNPERRKSILAGWKQFMKDLETFELPAPTPKAQAAEVETLPVIAVQVAGQITVSNVDQVKSSVDQFLAKINRDLQTDDDFATAEVVIKRCTEAEKQAKVAKQGAVDQMADVSKVFRTIDSIIAAFRDTRLDLEKLVKAEKNRRRAELTQDAADQIQQYIHQANKRLGDVYIEMQTTFAQVIKGKKSLANMQSAINDQIAQYKIELAERETAIRGNLETLVAIDPLHRHLFPDAYELAKLPAAELKMTIENRIMKFEDDQRKAEEEKARQAEAQRQAAQPEPEKTPEIAAETVSDDGVILAWASRMQEAAMSKPHILDRRLSSFAQTRFNRIMAIIEEIKRKSS